MGFAALRLDEHPSWVPLEFPSEHPTNGFGSGFKVWSFFQGVELGGLPFLIFNGAGSS